MKRSKSSCIYKITNIINNKFYIGSTIHYNIRVNSHLSLLRRNKHHCHHLQSSFNKYGEVNFKFEIIEKCILSELRNRERYYIEQLTPIYNIIKSSDEDKFSYENRKKKGKLSPSKLLSFREKMAKTRGKVCKTCGEYNKKVVIEEDKEGNIKEWSCVSDAARYYNPLYQSNRSTNIWKALSGKRKTAYKKKWYYKNI